MTVQTFNEKKALLLLFKDFTIYYNANSLSKELGISRIGAMKLLRKLQKEELVISKKIGKSIIYKPNIKNDYVDHLIAFLLAEEAHNFKRWKEEFKELFVNSRVVLFYGSASKDYTKARDIDIMIIRKTGESGEIHKIISKKQQLLPKKIHAIDLTPEEFIGNVIKKQIAMVDIVKTAIVLYGYDKYVELIKNVASI